MTLAACWSCCLLGSVGGCVPTAKEGKWQVGMALFDVLGRRSAAAISSTQAILCLAENIAPQEQRVLVTQWQKNALHYASISRFVLSFLFFIFPSVFIGAASNPTSLLSCNLSHNYSPPSPLLLTGGSTCWSYICCDVGGGDTSEGGRGRGGCWVGKIGENKKTHCMRRGRWGCRNEGRKEKRESSRDEIWRLKDESTCEKGLWTNRLTITKEAWVTSSLTAMRAAAAIAVLTERAFKETVEFDRAREVSPHTSEVWWVKLRNDSVWEDNGGLFSAAGSSFLSRLKKSWASVQSRNQLHLLLLLSGIAVYMRRSWPSKQIHISEFRWVHFSSRVAGCPLCIFNVKNTENKTTFSRAEQQKNKMFIFVKNLLE